MYRAPALRTRTIPTTKVLKRIMARADDDNPATRDPRDLMSVLMAMRSVDSRLRGHILTRQTAVSAFGWTLTPHDPADDERTARARRRLRSVIPEIIRHQVQAVLYDAFALELGWGDSADGIAPVAIRRYKPVELEKVSDYTINIVGDNPSRMDRLMRLSLQEPNEQFIIDISDDDMTGGLLRSTLGREVLIADMLAEWGNYNAKLKGILQGIYEVGASPDERSAAEGAMRTAIENNYILTSDAIKFQLNELAKAGSGSSFREIIEMARADIAIGLLGQANTSEISKGSGSRAALQVLNLVRADIHYDDIVRTEAIINDQLIAHDHRLNTGSTSEAPYVFQFSMPEEIDLETRARVVIDAFNSKMALDTDEAYAYLGLRRPKDVVEDTLLKKDDALL